MKTKTLILTLLLGLLTFIADAQVDEQTKFNMFCSALDNFSTAPNYVVITVKNLKTGETKEVCNEAPFIQGAMGREIGNWTIKCNKYPTRYFELEKDSALWNISFDQYSKNDLEDYAKTINIESIVEQVRIGRLTSKTFMGDRKEQIMFAHLMFNNGVMMTRGCFAGNICGLSYFKK